MNKCTERLYNGLIKRKSYLRSDVRYVSDPGGYNICHSTVLVWDFLQQSFLFCQTC